MTRTFDRIARAAAAMAGAFVAGWAVYAGFTWLRYGSSRRRVAPDALLDRYMPDYEVAERHEIEVAAPASATFAAARAASLDDSRVVRAIFRGRELLMGAPHGARHGGPRPGGLLEQTLALGWGVLADVPGREIVVGAVTQPWRADVRFRAIPPGDFATFSAPGYAKIVWTLAAEPLGPGGSLFRTEMRVVTTDAASRRRFRLYWSFLSPGIRLIRSRMLRLVKSKAEGRKNHRPSTSVGNRENELAGVGFGRVERATRGQSDASGTSVGPPRNLRSR